MVVTSLNETTNERILATKDTRLSAYDFAKSKSNQAVKVLSIKNDSEYQELRTKMERIMTKDLQSEYFPSKVYKGGKKDYYVVKDSVKGEIVDADSYVFKYELKLVKKDQKVPLTILIYVKNNLVYKIQSLG